MHNANQLGDKERQTERETDRKREREIEGNSKELENE